MYNHKRDIVSDWRDELKPGDIVKSGSGTLRVVRRVSMNPNAPWLLGFVYFSILRCSKYRACYTLYLRSELRSMGFTKINGRIRLDSQLDAAILRDTQVRDGRDRKLTCCDVIGIVA